MGGRSDGGRRSGGGGRSESGGGVRGGREWEGRSEREGVKGEREWVQSLRELKLDSKAIKPNNIYQCLTPHTNLGIVESFKGHLTK